MTGRRIAWVAGLAVLIAGVWILRIEREVRRPYDEQVLERKTFTARYPRGWEKVTQDPEFERLAAFEGVDSAAGGAGLTVEDRGQAEMGSVVSEMRKKAYSVTPVAETRLGNGLEAGTWTELTPMGELTDTSRWIVFKAPNGRVYSANYSIPAAWTTRRRLEHIYGRILASMQFK